MENIEEFNILLNDFYLSHADTIISIEIFKSFLFNKTIPILNEKNTIYNNINNAIQKFFAAYCVVGADVSLNALTAAINNSLSNFQIADVNIDIANTVIANKRNVIEIGNTQRAMPNKVLTSIEFVGGV